MSVPDRILGNQETPAAISRFFYNLELVPGSGIDNPYRFDEQVYDRYKDFLLHPISRLQCKVLYPDGRIEDRQDAVGAPPAVISLGFDISNRDRGVFGWHINVANGPDLGPTTHGRNVYTRYSGLRQSIVGRQDYDLQGRTQGDYRIADSQRARSFAQGFQIILARLVDFDELDREAAALVKRRGDLAQEIIKFMQTHCDSEKNLKDRQAMEQQLANAGFSSVHNRLDVNQGVPTTCQDIVTIGSDEACG